MSSEPGRDDQELRRLHSEVAALQHDISDRDDQEQRHETLIARLRRDVAVRDEDAAVLRARLEAAEHELEDLRVIRDALTPPELPQRTGLELAAAFLLAAAERVSGDFYLVAAGPQDSTVLVVGDVAGHGLQAARRAAFVRTTFAATAPFSDDPRRLLSWANTALIERAGISSDFVTAACVTYLPDEHLLRWAYAGHPPALWLDDGSELTAATQGTLLGVGADPGGVVTSRRSTAGAGVLLYTDGLTEARRDGEQFGLDRVRAALGELQNASPGEAVAILRARVAEFAYGTLTDDLCLLAARIVEPPDLRSRCEAGKNDEVRRERAAVMAERDDRGVHAEEAAPATSELQREIQARTQQETDQTAADLDQTYADTDQAAADVDQLTSDADQAVAIRDQHASDRDQAAADREQSRTPATAESEQAHDASRDERDAATEERGSAAARRSKTTGRRADTAARRDDVARGRDLTAAARDRIAQTRDEAADARDAAAEAQERHASEAGSPDQAGAPPESLRDTGASLRMQSARDRVAAADDRDAAAADREEAAADRDPGLDE
jgi:serine phosphatase RsbU (regulator of sigma subunit)